MHLGDRAVKVGSALFRTGSYGLGVECRRQTGEDLIVRVIVFEKFVLSTLKIFVSIEEVIACLVLIDEVLNYLTE